MAVTFRHLLSQANWVERICTYYAFTYICRAILSTEGISRGIGWNGAREFTANKSILLFAERTVICVRVPGNNNVLAAPLSHCFVGFIKSTRKWKKTMVKSMSTHRFDGWKFVHFHLRSRVTWISLDVWHRWMLIGTGSQRLVKICSHLLLGHYCYCRSLGQIYAIHSVHRLAIHSLSANIVDNWTAHLIIFRPNIKK